MKNCPHLFTVALVQRLAACVLSSGLLSGALLSGCGGSPSATGTDADAGRPPSIALDVRPALFTGEGKPQRLLSNGDTVEIALAEQGGEVLYVGAEIRGLEATLVVISTKLSDPDTGRVHAEETREIRVRSVDGATATLEPDLRSRNQVSHLIVCPNTGSRPLFDVPWQLEIEIESTEGTHQGRTEVEVTPRCDHEDAAHQQRCVCECEPDYSRGKCTIE